ncbi:hypothetical protein KAX75_07855 [candidate division WOR-3 bacterium]|nr:hypothetical protein [candidate division WOR-3 bacterium]
MNNKLLFIFSFLILFFSFLYSYTLPESSASGESMGAVTGKYTALGGSTIMGEAWSNPALLIKNPGFKIVIGGGFIKSGERRKKSIFDSFDNRIGDVTVADNSFVFCEPTYVSASYTSKYSLGFDVNILPILNYDYRYYKEVRDDFYILKETVLDEGKGKLYLLNLGIAYELLKEKLSFGIGFNLYTGKREYEYIRDYVDPSKTDISEDFSRNLGGNGVTFGLHAHPLTRIRLGGFVSTKATIGDYAEDYIPLRMGGGITIVPPNTFPALFIIDGAYERWNEVNDNYEDVVKLHLGVEHAFSPGLNGRFGFGYETSYLSRNMPKVYFTFGFGFEKGGYAFDTGVKVCRFDFSGDDVAIEQRDMEGVTRVEESLIKLIFSVTYRR